MKTTLVASLAHLKFPIRRLLWAAIEISLGLVATAWIGPAPAAHADQWNCTTNPYINTTNCSGPGGGFYQRSTSCQPMLGECTVSDYYVPGRSWNN